MEDGSPAPSLLRKISVLKTQHKKEIPNRTAYNEKKSDTINLEVDQDRAASHKKLLVLNNLLDGIEKVDKL